MGKPIRRSDMNEGDAILERLQTMCRDIDSKCPGDLPCPFVDRGLDCEDVTSADWLGLFTEVQDEQA